jgi:tRNA G37 N-methylase Trm5
MRAHKHARTRTHTHTHTHTHLTYRCATITSSIGYFTLPYLVKAGAAHVYACEWNPHAVEALRRNIVINSVADRCTVLEGDNAKVAPRNVADRVNLGLIPSSERGWPVACAALRQDKGGWMHVHDNVEVPRGVEPTDAFAERGAVIAAALQGMLQSGSGRRWSCVLRHAERVKSYAPRVYHMVFDIEARPLSGSGGAVNGPTAASGGDARVGGANVAHREGQQRA